MQLIHANALAAFAIQDFAEPLEICALVVVGGGALFILRIVLGVRRFKVRLNDMRERMRLLSKEQLAEIMRTPTHPDSQFALAELMRRGVDARPTKDQLFGMLTSGNPVLCGHAMANLQIFYPKLVIPNGASNQDSPELWRSRIEEFQREV
jgi:hypothetical protein